MPPYKGSVTLSLVLLPWLCYSLTLPVTRAHEPRAVCETNTRGRPTACHLPLAQSCSTPRPLSRPCSCSAGKLLGPPGPPLHPHPALLLCSVRGPHRGAGTWVKLRLSHQTAALHTASDGPSSASLPAHPTRGCSCSLSCVSSPHTLTPSSFASCFSTFGVFFHPSAPGLILIAENTNTSTPKTRPLLGWVCPGGLPWPQPISAPVWPCPAGLPALPRPLVTRDSALPLPPLQGQQDVTCDPTAGDAVLGTTMRN